MEESNRPDISIVIPVFNGEKYIERSVTSAINQSLSTIEILVIDDGSTDRTPALLQGISKSDSRVRVFSKKNAGLSNTRNFGIDQARGEFILHLDADDWIDPDCCESLLVRAKRENADIIITNYFLENGKRTKTIRDHLPHRVMNSTEYLERFVLRRCSGAIWNKLIRRDLYSKNGIRHYETISMGEDSTALLRLAKVATRICFLDVAFYHYRIDTNGMTRQKNKPISQYLDGLRAVEDYFNSLENNRRTSVHFQLLRLRIVYTQLHHCSYSSAKEQNLTEYLIVWERFLQELPEIVRQPEFYKMDLHYVGFVLVQYIKSKMFPVRRDLK